MFTANARVFLNPLGDLPFALHKADWQLFQDTLKEQEQELNIQQRLQQLNQEVKETSLVGIDLPEELATHLDTVSSFAEQFCALNQAKITMRNRFW